MKSRSWRGVVIWVLGLVFGFVLIGPGVATVPAQPPTAWLIQITGNPQLILPPVKAASKSKVDLKKETVRPGTKTSSLPFAKPLSALYQGYEIVLKARDSVTLLIPSSSTRRVYRGPGRLKVKKEAVSVRWGDEPSVFPIPVSYFDTLDAWLDHSHTPKAGVAIAAEGMQVLAPLNGSLLLTRNVEFKLAGLVPEDSQLILYGPDGKRFWTQMIEGPDVEFPRSADFDWGQRFTWEIRKKTGGRLARGDFAIADESLASHLLSQKLPLSKSTPHVDLLIYGLKLDMVGAFHETEEVFELIGMTHDRSRWPVGRPSASTR
ncbi:MAG: hypothetical protein QE278_08235 [Limnobacter sp.]|nr:hypothetical protein [Limnobacter sp.]